MRFRVGTYLLLVVLISCSTPKYVYDFGQPDGATIQRSEPSSPSQPVSETPTSHPITATPGQPVVNESPVPSKVQLRRKTFAPVPKTSAFSKPRMAIPEKNSVASKPDLLRSALFVAGGLILLFIGSDTLVVLGTMAILIGVIFGIKWLLNDKK